MIKLAIVSPCYNEEEVLNESADRLVEIFKQLKKDKLISEDSFVLYVNDGSKDNTWSIIKQLHQTNSIFHGLCLAGNVGHQNAIMAGMMKVKDQCDAAITMDADIQDDLNAIPKMISAFNDGADIVYGVKVQRTADPLLKRLSAEIFYKLQSTMGVKAVYNHADFRLMSARALQFLAQYPERNLYLRGMIPLMGLKSATVEDIISQRTAGSSKYTLKKMLHLAFDGITSFSITPIRWITGLGVVSLIFSMIMIFHVIWDWCMGNVVAGWSEIMVSVWLLGSIIIIGLGVIGEYIGKIYSETKHRPLWHEGEYIE